MSYIVENNIQLAKNFKLSEFACKHCGKVRIDMELVYVLQRMRDKIGKINIPIASGALSSMPRYARTT